MCSQLNFVVHNESCVRCRIIFSAANQVFTDEFVWSPANQVFTAPIALFTANHVFNVEFCYRCDSGFCCQILLTAAIHVFTAQICVLCSEILLSVVNQVFATECCTQRIRFPLLNLCGPQRIRCLLSYYVVHNE